MDIDSIKKNFFDLWQNFQENLPRLLVGLFIFLIFYVVANYYYYQIINSNNNMYSEQQMYLNTRNLIYSQLSKFVYYAIIFIGLSFALSYVGVNMTAIITLLGVIGFAVGLSMQNSLQNIISGIYITLLGMFQIGDLIALQTLSMVSPTYGKIIDFNLFYTTIQQSGQSAIIEIPNSLFQSNLISIIKS